MKRIGSLLFALLSIGLVGCNEDQTSGSNSTPNSSNSSTSSSESSKFEDLTIQEQIVYLEDLITPYSNDVVSSQREDSESLVSYSNGALEVYSKDSSTSTLYSSTKTNVIESIGSIQFGDDDDEDKTISSYEMQRYHDDEYIYTLIKYADDTKAKKTSEFGGRESEVSLQFIPSIIQDLETIYGYMDVDGVDIELKCELGDTLYFSYSLTYDDTLSSGRISTLVEYDMAIKDDHIDSLRYGYDYSLTVSSITQSTKIVSDNKFGYDAVTAFDKELFDPTEFVSSED